MGIDHLYEDNCFFSSGDRLLHSIDKSIWHNPHIHILEVDSGKFCLSCCRRVRGVCGVVT